MKIISIRIMNTFLNVISGNKYLNKCKVKNRIDINSIFYLLPNIHFNQSTKIKFGYCLESLIRDIVDDNLSFEILHTEIKRRKLDLIMKSKTDVYHFEIKCNINLDTEKSKSVCMKCEEIGEILTELYPEHKITSGILNMRYLEYKDVPKNIKFKYNVPIFGVNDILNILGIDSFSDYSEYKKLLYLICDKIISN